MQVLKVREDHVRSVLDEGRRRLGEVTKDSTRYSDVLFRLIVQGLYLIMEPKTIIRSRQVDQALIQQLLPNAVAEYKQKTGKDVNVILDTETFLPPGTCGGIELFALNGRLRVNSPSKRSARACIQFDATLFRYRTLSRRVWS